MATNTYCELPSTFLALYCIVLYLYFMFTNTLVVKYQLVQGCLNYVYIIIKKRKLEWRRAHYSKTNYGPLTRLALFYCSFVIH